MVIFQSSLAVGKPVIVRDPETLRLPRTPCASTLIHAVVHLKKYRQLFQKETAGTSVYPAQHQDPAKTSLQCMCMK